MLTVESEQLVTKKDVSSNERRIGDLMTTGDKLNRNRPVIPRTESVQQTFDPLARIFFVFMLTVESEQVVTKKDAAILTSAESEAWSAAYPL